MGIAGRFAGDGAQTKTLRRVETGAFDSPVVERETLGLAVFEEQFAVIHSRQSLGDDGLDPARLHPGALKKQFVGDGEIGHPQLHC